MDDTRDQQLTLIANSLAWKLTLSSCTSTRIRSCGWTSRFSISWSGTCTSQVESVKEGWDAEPSQRVQEWKCSCGWTPTFKFPGAAPVVQAKWNAKKDRNRTGCLYVHLIAQPQVDVQVQSSLERHVCKRSAIQRKVGSVHTGATSRGSIHDARDVTEPLFSKSLFRLPTSI